MNFIDISSWQYGLNLETLFYDNPDLDGVVVKSTGGVSYTQTTCDQWIQWLHKHGKPFGWYHYLDDDGQHASGAMEARYFVDNTRNYFGLGVPFVDYEANAVNRGTKYLLEFLDTVYALTNVKCGVYCSLSVVQSQDFSAIAKRGYPLWVAQYADMAVVNGFVDKPWQKGSVAPFDRYIMHQYTSNGRLKGYANALDLDKFYGTAEDWHKLATHDNTDQEPSPVPSILKPASPQVVLDVLKGTYGIGDERKRKLREAGYDYDSVQSKINQLYGIAGKVRDDIGKEMQYLNSILWIARS